MSNSLVMNKQVDLTSSDTFNNLLLFDKNKYLPMNLSIRRKGDSSPLYSWPFQARIGSHTIVQEYWDGTIASSAYNPVPQMPHYDQSGEYEVVVAVDTGVWRTNYTNHAKAFLATIPEPTLTAFSKATVNVDVAGYNKLVSIDWDLLAKSNLYFPNVTQKLASLVDTEPYALASDIYQRFNIAQSTIPDLAGTEPLPPKPTKELDSNTRNRVLQIKKLNLQAEELLANLYDLKAQNNLLNNELAALTRQELSDVMDELRQNLLEVLKEDWLDYSSKSNLFHSLFQNTMRQTAIDYISNMALSTRDTNLGSHYKVWSQIQYLLEEIANKVRNRNNPQKHGQNYLCNNPPQDIATYIEKDTNALFQRLKKIEEHEFQLITNDPDNLDALLQVNFDIQNLFVQTYKTANLFDEVCDKCTNTDVRQAMLNDQRAVLDRTPFARNFVAQNQLECRICGMDTQSRNSTKIALQVRKGLKVAGDPVGNVGVGQLEGRTIAFSLIKDGDIRRLVVAFSGVDKLGAPRDDLQKQLAFEEVAKRRIANEPIQVGGSALTKEEIILAKEACPPFNIFPSLKTYPCRGEQSEADSNQNDAEIKILEEVRRQHPDNLDKYNISLDLMSDRITCGFCQETIERTGADPLSMPWAIYPVPFKLGQFFADGKPFFLNELINPTIFADALVEAKRKGCAQ